MLTRRQGCGSLSALVLKVPKAEHCIVLFFRALLIDLAINSTFSSPNTPQGSVPKAEHHIVWKALDVSMNGSFFPNLVYFSESGFVFTNLVCFSYSSLIFLVFFSE